MFSRAFLYALIALAILFSGCSGKSHTTPQVPSDNTPPQWNDQAGIQAVISGDSSVTIQWGSATDADSPPVRYLLYKDIDSNPWDQTPIEVLTNDPYKFTGLVNGQEYWFGVRCSDSADPPNLDSNTYSLFATPLPGPQADTTPPVWDVQNGIFGAYAGDHSVRIVWYPATDVQTPPVTYLLYMDTDDNPWDQIPIEYSPAENDFNGDYVFADLEEYHQYWFGVRCHDSANPPNYDTNGDVATTFTWDTIPPSWDSTVGIVNVTSLDSSVRVEWGTASDTNSPPVVYCVYVDTDSNPFDHEPIEKTSNNPLIVSGLSPGETYYFGVRCRDSYIDRGHLRYNYDDNETVQSATPSGARSDWIETWDAHTLDVAVDYLNNIYVTGYFYIHGTDTTVDFDPGDGVNQKSNGTFLMKLVP